MRVLALDISSPSGSIALLNDGVVEGEVSAPGSITHSTWLPGAVKDFLEGAGRTLQDIDIFATTVGPGSFTGIRIAVSTVKGFAWPLGKKTYGACTLKAIALNIDPTDTAVCPVLDARKGEVYAALYRRGPGGLETLMPERVLSSGALFEEIAALGYGPVVFTGSGLKACASEALSGAGQGRLAPEGLWGVRAGVVARMAFEDMGGAVAPELLSPVYLRKDGTEFKKPGKFK